VEDFSGFVMMLFAVTMVLVAIPSQIRKHYKEKRSGLSFLMLLLPFGTYASRLYYGFTIKSWYLIVPDVIGAALFIVLFAQYFYYRKKIS